MLSEALGVCLCMDYSLVRTIDIVSYDYCLAQKVHRLKVVLKKLSSA
jgi:hypothetical protein